MNMRNIIIGIGIVGAAGAAGVEGALLFQENQQNINQSFTGAKIISSVPVGVNLNVLANDTVIEKINEPSAVRAAVIKDGRVVNTVLLPEGWTGKRDDWQPPEGSEIIFSENAGLGDGYDSGKFYQIQKAPKPEATIEELAQKKNLTDKEEDQLLRYLLEQVKKP